MPKRLSAGIVLFRRRTFDNAIEVLLVHPGGPYFRRKDDGFWTIPKGELEEGESPQRAACREFSEELGAPAPKLDELTDLGQVRQKGGKVVHGFAVAGALPDGWVLSSSTFEMEWPPRSGRRQSFPEIDDAQWWALPDAYRKINEAQRGLLDRLREVLSHPGAP